MRTYRKIAVIISFEWLSKETSSSATVLSSHRTGYKNWCFRACMRARKKKVNVFGAHTYPDNIVPTTAPRPEIRISRDGACSWDCPESKTRWWIEPGDVTHCDGRYFRWDWLHSPRGDCCDLTTAISIHPSPVLSFLLLALVASPVAPSLGWSPSSFWSLSLSLSTHWLECALGYSGPE